MKCLFCLWLCEALDLGRENASPEGWSVDPEHSPSGKAYSHWNPLYWVSVIGEWAFDGPCSRLRKVKGG